MPRSSKRKVSKGIQTSPRTTVENPAKPGGLRVRYWKRAAERRLTALYDCLEEKEKLKEEYEELSQKLSNTEKLLDEANQFIELVKGTLGCSNNDSDNNDSNNNDSNNNDSNDNDSSNNNSNNNDIGTDGNDVSILEDSMNEMNNEANDSAYDMDINNTSTLNDNVNDTKDVTNDTANDKNSDITKELNASKEC